MIICEVNHLKIYLFDSNKNCKVKINYIDIYYFIFSYEVINYE